MALHFRHPHVSGLPHLPMSRLHPAHGVFLAAFLVVLVWSGIGPKDRLTWFLEVVPGMAGAVALAWLYPRHRLTTLVYGLISLHAIVLCVGGHYTYAEVPAFDWLRDRFGLDRNYYDRVGHFMQGFVPAMIAREILVRAAVVRGTRWLFFLVTCVCLAISAFYEFIEWWVAVASGTAAEAFLGTQGDVWDTQWDMFIALIGAMVAQWTLARWHDRAIDALGVEPRQSP
jgi:putative membrane protein